MMTRLEVSVASALMLCVFAGSAAGAVPLTTDRLRVQRKEVFEFTEKPTVAVDGDRVTVKFTVKDYCDATVAIETASTGSTGSGQAPRIVRHLASGVLGENAPEPFQKNSKSQTLVWDGKDEIGRYIDDKDSVVVRVSLGLKARMERTLFWSPQKMGFRSQIQFRTTPEGIYVLNQVNVAQIRLFDHDGNYVRTVYPFPAQAIRNVRGIEWLAFPPDGEKLPSKLRGHDQDSFLDEAGFNSMTAANGRIYLVGNRLTIIGTAPDGKDTVLDGPVLGEPIGEKTHVAPTSCAVSPDGKWLYVTGYIRAFTNGGHRYQDWMHAVCRVQLDRPDAQREVFVGQMAWSATATDGGDKRFRCPMSVACDAKGRVYVADHYNDRVQVFNPDATLYKTLPVHRPALIRIDPKTGRLYVFSWSTYFRPLSRMPNWATMVNGSVSPTLRVFESIEKPDEIAAYSIPYVPRGGDYQKQAIGEFTATADVDFTTDLPTIWLAPGVTGRRKMTFWEDMNVRVLVPKDGKLVTVRDFQAEANKMLARARPQRHGRPRPYVNPVTGELYIGEHTQPTVVACKSFSDVLVIDPNTGRVTLKQLPTDPEDMGFDFEGRAYLRTYNSITRFDPNTWREIPYDYGEKQRVHHGAGGGGERPYNAMSAITLPSSRGGMFHLGGVAVAPDGTVAVSCINPKHPNIDQRIAPKDGGHGGYAYLPRVYPGRLLGWEVHMFDKYGKIMKDDAAPGLNVTTALRLDRDHNLYALAAGAPLIDGKRYFNGRGCTLIKLIPGKMKGLSDKGVIPLPPALRPERHFDITRPGIWVEGAEWLFGPIGAEGHYGSGGKCSCYVHGNFDLDWYGRAFAMEVDRFRAVVLDKNGNVILRIGKYGNVDDGVPLVKPEPGLARAQGFQPPTPRSIGGDEVAIMHAQNLAVHTDNRLFLADVGNQCVRAVKLDYHVNERMPLRERGK